MFFTADSAEPFRFKLQCLEAELQPSKHVAIFITQTLVHEGRFSKIGKMTTLFRTTHSRGIDIVIVFRNILSMEKP